MKQISDELFNDIIRCFNEIPNKRINGLETGLKNTYEIVHNLENSASIPWQKVRIVVGLSGGLIQWIIGENTKDLEIAIADFDVDGRDHKRINTSNEEDVPCNLYYDTAGEDKELTGLYFNQIEN